MKFLFTLFYCLFFVLVVSAQQTNPRPKIGLTLSGGGAKGLAHIGILKAIDSAGLSIDYITGTSMGAIVGALYATGYSGKEIENLRNDIDFDVLFSNNVPLKTLSMEEKLQYSRFAIELPFINNKIRLTTGVITGQELNMKFSELFFHVYHIRNFDQFKIPFKCMATDLETGDLVVLDSGNIISALQATMAIPSVFSAVTRDNKKLVDGGLVRNFPVKNVKEMGADIVIGSNVTSGLAKIDKIKNPVDVLLQMAFFREAGDFKEELPLTNIYIHMPLEDYNTGSFGSGKEIMDIGVETGRLYYPVFKKLADSINALGAATEKPQNIITNKTVFITNYTVNGLKKTTAKFFIHLMNFHDNRYYTAAQINKSIRRAYGSRYYSSISYTLEPVSKDTARIIFTAEENPNTYLKAGLYYTRFRGINVNVNLTSRDFISPNSRSMVSLSLGESTQVEAEHFQYLGRIKNLAFIAGFRLDNQEINTYRDYELDGAYKQNFSQGFINFQNSGNNKIAGGIGTAYEYIRFSPAVPSVTEVKGRFTNLKSYVYFKYNDLNQIFFPTRGLKINTELAQVYNQRPNLRLFENGTPVIPSNLNFENFSRFTLDASLFTPLNKKFNFLAELQAGINFTNQPNYLNNFLIGGLNGSFRNQVRFAGLQEATLNSSSVLALQLGLRYNPASNIYITGRINGLVKNFATRNNITSAKDGLSGYALTFAYKTPIGPIELSAMYSDQSKKLQSYIMLGIPF
ncbi:MAG: patatin-like phospholipase family protein [Chitinophagaceae bacterium]|nr:patatin-like phospholipase family protein [Chitinophagaceae bacterium]